MLARAAEVASIVAARSRGEPGVVVAADRGAGRTMVVAGVVEALRGAGVDVLVIRATASSRIFPLSALVGVVAEAGAKDGSLYESIEATLRVRAASGGFVVVVDDAHLLDDASSMILAELVDSGQKPGSAFVVATAATGSTGSLVDHPALARVSLAPLGSAAMRDVWREHGAGHDGDRGLNDVIAVDPTAVSPGARRLLEAVAIAGGLPLRALAGIAETDAVPAALGSGLSVVEEEVRFAQPNSEAAVLAGIPRLRRRALTGVVVDALRDAGSSAGRSAQLVDLALEAGVPIDAVELREAASEAMVEADGGRALRLARAAANAGDVDDVVVWVDVAHRHGSEHELDAALCALSAASESVGGGADCDRSAYTCLAMARRDLWRRADPTAALSRLPVGDARLDAARAELLAVLGDDQHAIEVASPLVDDGDLSVRRSAAGALAHALRRRGSPSAAVAVLDAVDRSSSTLGQQLSDFVRVLALVDAGRWIEASEAAATARRAAVRAGDQGARALAEVGLAAVLCDQGHVADAARTAQSARTLAAEVHSVMVERWAWTIVAFAAGLSGDRHLADAVLERLAADGVKRGSTTLDGFEARARAWAAVDRLDACRRLRAAAFELSAGGDVGAAAACLHDLAVLGDPAQASTLLAELTVDGDEPMAALRSDHAQALARSDHRRLSRLDEAFAAMGGDRLALECASGAAQAAARRGERRLADRYAEHALRRAETCSGLASPAVVALRALAAVGVPLTGRERDVAERAARGRSNRSIAEELTLSERTVENHLARCYDKLGVRSRDELGRVLGFGSRP